MCANGNVLGIDIGSVAVAVAEVGRAGEVLKSAYDFHHGDVAGRLTSVLQGFDRSRIDAWAATSSTPPIIDVDGVYDNQMAVIASVLHFHEKAGSILVVGGERFGAVFFDENGRYRNFKANSSCAAGTGGFLDQQARRLNLGGIEALSDLAFHNRGALPKIASRCAVFAKTDLVHAQQEGYSLEEICDGLCHGLARNIVDTLFSREKPLAPLIFTGGVSRNRAVARHVRDLLDIKILVDPTGVYGAAGAALSLLRDSRTGRVRPSRHSNRKQASSGNLYPPLRLVLSDYPDFEGLERYAFIREDADPENPVEVDIYERIAAGSSLEAWLGFDIGSTSTKAVLLDRSGKVVGGFYNRTAGRPITAVQSILAAIDDVARRSRIDVRIIGAGTTGSGRKLMGGIIGADLIVDEITAHARAARELNPDVDTIIEIGGQDSKFTTLKNGLVTFANMNTVCAAGTGSFIEEQALRLGCPLEEYSARAENQMAPLASDRCTVFMERDINHYLREGYTPDEVLASVLHSVRENYLTKVATESAIGRTILFQGATAKNRALVAAFEQRLNQPIHVSRYCHLTGALGTALILADSGVEASTFRGLGLWRRPIPVRTEICELCTNHCKIVVAEVGGQTFGYGFLCGRDYGVRKHVDNNRSGFDLLRERRRVFRTTPAEIPEGGVTVGLPAVLHMVDDLPLWRRFFDELSIKTVTSEACVDGVKQGRHLADADFCAPMTAMYGHIQYLAPRCDRIFFPFYLERKSSEKGLRRQYCYYTQYAPALAAELCPDVIAPLVHYLYSSLQTKIELYRALKPILPKGHTFFSVAAAFSRAVEFMDKGLERLRAMYREKSIEVGDLHVILVGRPYLILDPAMNKNILDIFASMGIRTFFQDMIDAQPDQLEAVNPLLQEITWHYAAKVLETTEIAARTEGAYPVFLTSFMCSPDSFAIEYFKKIMEAHQKPYLILSLDEHDSSVGYETRIEAAVRSFRNHLEASHRKPAVYGPSIIPSRVDRLHDRTFFMPNWEPATLKLIAANLRREGFDARVLEENETNIRRSMRFNTGQCIPLNIFAQQFIEQVEKQDLDPAKTAMWMPISNLSCNLSLYPHHLKTILHDYGRGMEKAGVYRGLLSFLDLSVKLPLDTYLAIMFGGLLRKIGCEIRPYEKIKGSTDKVLERGISALEQAFLGKTSKKEALDRTVSELSHIEKIEAGRPRVAIFGDFYVRDNDVMSRNLVRFIEKNGGEAVPTPYHLYLKMIAGPYIRKWLVEGKYYDAVTTEALLAIINRLEKSYNRMFGRITDGLDLGRDRSFEKILAEYHVRMENTGESMDNLLKIHHLEHKYPDIALFVQTSPAFCCPSVVTEAMARRIEKKTGIPVVSITYDGIGGHKNDVILPFLEYPRRPGQRRALAG